MRFPIAIALASTALAQTFTDCNPLNTTCPDSKGLNAASFSTDFTKASGNTLPAGWSAAQGTTMTFGPQGAEFIINKPGQAPTIETDFYIFYGVATVVLKASTGPGIISSIVLESDDLDEIDWEFFGSGQYQPMAQTNFFGKGNTTTYDRATFHPVSLAPMEAFHTYTVDWNPDRIIFSVDGAVVRTLLATDPLTIGRYNYPQTPCRLKLGNWAGGAKGAPQGTLDWAGGETNYDSVPYTMTVTKVELTNLNPGTSYTWTNKSGSDSSIKVNKDGSSSSSGTTDEDDSDDSKQTTTSKSVSSFPTGKPGPQDGGFGLLDEGATRHIKAAAPASTGFMPSGSANATMSTSTRTHSGAEHTASSPAQPAQQDSASAAAPVVRPGFDSATLASIGVFTLGMCVWML